MFLIGTFRRPPNIGTFQKPLNIKTLHQPLSIGTFHRPSSWGLFSPPSFSFSLETRIQVIWLFFPNITFNLNLEKTYSYNFPWEEKNDQFQQMVEREKIDWMIMVLLKEWSEEGQFWELEISEKFHKPYWVWQHNFLLI